MEKEPTNETNEAIDENAIEPVEDTPNKENSEECKESCLEENEVFQEAGENQKESIEEHVQLEDIVVNPNNEEVDNSININIDNPKQRILWAAENNEVDVVRQLLEETPTLVNARDEDLYTPLHRACSNNHTEIIKLMLSNGADLGARTEDGWCPLHCACRWDSVEAASLLLQNGANVNSTSKGGLSPLHLAAANSSGRRTLELLLWHPHIDGSLKAENGDTAYDIVCRTSNISLRLFELLEDAGNCF